MPWFCFSQTYIVLFSPHQPNLACSHMYDVFDHGETVSQEKAVVLVTFEPQNEFQIKVDECFVICIGSDLWDDVIDYYGYHFCVCDITDYHDNVI